MIWDKFQKLSPRERGLLALATVAVLAAVGNFLVVQPTLVRLKAMDEEIEKKVVLREKNNVMLEDRLLVEEEYRIAGGLLRVSKSSAEAVEDIKEKVGELAGRTGVALDSISHREPTPLGHCRKYVIEISRFQARMPDLLRFLHVLSTSEGMLRVSRLSIKPKKKSEMVEGSLAITRVALEETPAQVTTAE